MKMMPMKTRAKIIMERNLPRMICALLMGEENSSLMEPLLYSRLISPMVSRGM